MQSKPYHQDTDVKLLSQATKSLQKLAESLLTIRQFSTTAVICAEESHDRVNDEKTILSGAEVECKDIQQLHLVLTVESAADTDVVAGLLWVDSEALSDLDNSFWSECALSINPSNLSLGATHLFWKLCDDCHCVTDLSLAATELSINLTDTHGFKATSRG